MLIFSKEKFNEPTQPALAGWNELLSPDGQPQLSLGQ